MFVPFSSLNLYPATSPHFYIFYVGVLLLLLCFFCHLYCNKRFVAVNTHSESEYQSAEQLTTHLQIPGVSWYINNINVRGTAVVLVYQI